MDYWITFFCLLFTFSLAQDLNWWQTGAVYQIYPRSFQDSDGDGVGDLKGITSRLDYLVDIGVNTIWLSPIFKSPMADFGYDISDFLAIDPIFGTMEDYEELVREMKARDMHLVLDFVPNHSSNQHEWFQKSLNMDPQYSDYYVWKDPVDYDADGNPIPPNNWLSNFGFSAWEWNEQRNQFYLHQFLKEEPDLNYRNPLVIQELKDIITFWLAKGADGFRIDAVAFMFEDPEFRDEPPSGNPNFGPDEYDSLLHIYTRNYNETYDVMRELRVVVDNFQSDVSKLILLEAYESIDLVMRYYGTAEEPIADLPFNFEYLLRFEDEVVTGTRIKDAADLWLDNMPEGKWANWVTGNHDRSRIASKVDPRLVDGVNMINLLMPGTPITYYGEEIGMINTFISYEDTQDPFGCNFGPDMYEKYSRDPERTPMQWDSSVNSGFSTAEKPWLPLNPNYLEVNVKNQLMAEESHLKIYKEIINLRKELAIQRGELQYLNVDESLFSFMRVTVDPTNQNYMVLVNFGETDSVVDVSANSLVPPVATVVIKSLSSTVTVGSVLQTSAIHMGPKDSLVLSFNSNNP